MLKRVLIANRGEIAVRIIRACRERGIETVAVYSDADARSFHMTLADHAIHIGRSPAADSYLSIERILDAARQSGADAIHPGYGFLSENAEFAAACGENGLTFIGPPASAIVHMGSKIAARALATTAGVPIVPGETSADQSDAAIAAAANRVGFPVLLKPAGGGGGIGMKTVTAMAALGDAVTQARREAAAAFGDTTLYVERLIQRPRHVEFQVLADNHGHVIHLGERECSLQRRHQKVVEESPSVAMTASLRRRMGDAAIAVTRAAGYRNAGTIEFLLEGTGDDATFYFLEMNTRLQVEHPVTEQVVGIDLVGVQLAIAAGEALPWAQEDVSQRGHAIEVRIYAEDPAQHDLPQAGGLLLYREPTGPGIRVDAGVTEGDSISVYYDPMIAKLIASGASREEARRRALEALRHFPILGVRTNVAFLIELLERPQFIAGDLDTGFLDRDASTFLSRTAAKPTAAARAVAATISASPGAVPTDGIAPDPWSTLKDVRV